MTARTTRHVWFLGLWLLLPWPLFVTADAFVISACGDASVPRTIQ